MAIITDIELAAAMHLGDGVSTLSEPISSIVTRLNAVGQAYVQLYIPMASDPIKNECIVRFASYLYDAPSASADGRFAAAWFNSGASALAAPFMQLSVSGTAELSGGPGTPGMGIDQAAVNALISAAIYEWAQEGNTDLIPDAKLPAGRGGGGLSTSAVQALVQAGVADWAEFGNSDRIPIGKMPNEIVSGGNVSRAIFNALNARVQAIELFETDLHQEIELFSGDVVIATSNAAVGLTGAQWPILPTPDTGEQFHVSVSHRVLSALEHMGTRTFQMSDLEDLPLVTTGTQLTSPGNAINFSLIDSTGATVQFYLARRSINRQILFAADTIDTYTVEINRDRLDIESFAHLSRNNQVPVAKIPDIPASKITGLPAAGLTQAQVLALIHNWAEVGAPDLIPAAKLPAATALSGFNLGVYGLIEAWAQIRNRSTTIPVAKIPSLPSSKITGLPAAGLSESAVKALIADWAETDDTSIVPLDKLPDDEWASAEFEEGLRTGVAYPTGVTTIAGRNIVAYANMGLVNLDGSGDFPTWNTITTLKDGEFLQLKIERAPWPGNPLVYTDLGTYDVPYGTLENLAIPNDDPRTLSQSASHQFNLGSEIFRIAPRASNAEGISDIRIGIGNTGSFRYRLTITKSQPDIQAWARLSSSDLIPSDKFDGGLSTSEVQALIADWAEQGNTAIIPANKLPESSGISATRVNALEYFERSLRTTITASAGDTIRNLVPTTNILRGSQRLTPWGTPAEITDRVGSGVIYSIGITKLHEVASTPFPSGSSTRWNTATEVIYTFPIGTLENLTAINVFSPTLTDDNTFKFSLTINGTEETFRFGFSSYTDSGITPVYLVGFTSLNQRPSSMVTFYRFRLYASIPDFRTLARRTAPVQHLNKVTELGRITVTSVNNAPGRQNSFAYSGTIDDGDFCYIEFTPTSSSDEHAGYMFRMPNSGDDLSFIANMFAGSANSSNLIYAKITRAPTTVTMALIDNGQSDCLWLQGTYDFTRIDLDA